MASLPSLFVVSSGCTGFPLDDATREELTQAKAAALARSGPLDEERKKALADAKGRIGPRPDLGPCPIQPRAPAADDAGMWHDEEKSFMLGTAPFTVVKRELLLEVQGPRADRLDVAIVNDIDSMLFHNYRAPEEAEITKGVARAKELAGPDWLSVDGTLVVDEEVLPIVKGEKFETGTIRGVLYLWSYADHRIVCVADVFAESSDTLGVHAVIQEDGSYTASTVDLKRDLYRQGIFAGIRGLAAPGPRLLVLDGGIAP